VYKRHEVITCLTKLLARHSQIRVAIVTVTTATTLTLLLLPMMMTLLLGQGQNNVLEFCEAKRKSAMRFVAIQVCAQITKFVLVAA